jgi:DGQHR domain-containing protein
MAAVIKNALPPVVEYPALKGSFGRVTYFVTKSPLRDIAENLDLAPQGELSFGERIQRVIDEDRVKDEIVPYLQQNELRFFNALVCILLPDEDNDQPFWGFDEYKDDQGHSLGGLGKLRVAKPVARIVLDGQHRFKALRELWDQVKSEPKSPDRAIEVALVFVVVDDLGKFGTHKKDVRSKTIGVVRNLFAVLNKTARRVDTTTLLLIDDSDIANVMTRRFLEDSLIGENLIKWTGGQNLQPRDPYFTVIHVVKDAVSFYLRDFSEALREDYGREEEREKALKKYFEETPRVEVAVKEAIPAILNNGQPLRRWKDLLKRLKVEIPQQPMSTELTKDQAARIKDARDKELAYTVAGQKALFRGIIEAFQDQKRKSLADLKTILARADALCAAGLFSRARKDDNPFLEILFDSKGRMTWAEYAVEMSRRIIGKALGSAANEEAILADYAALTENDPDVVKRYWEKTREVWPR